MSTIRSFAVFATLAVTILSPLTARAQLSLGNGIAVGVSSIAISSAPGGSATTGAPAVGAIAVGSNANASEFGAIAIGNGSGANPTRATGETAVAIGDTARATNVGAAAYGSSSAADGRNSVAAGFGSVATDTGSVAIGTGANAQLGSVAIGSGSVANQANTVSVGSAGAERRVVNVAPGVNGTDAVNVDQLNTVAIGGAAPLVEQLINRMGALESRVDDVARTSYRGIAGVAAMQGAMPTAPGKTAVNMGVGAYEGYTAVGASVAHLSSNGRYNLNGGVSYSGGKSVGRVGVGFSF